MIIKLQLAINMLVSDMTAKYLNSTMDEIYLCENENEDGTTGRF